MNLKNFLVSRKKDLFYAALIILAFVGGVVGQANSWFGLIGNSVSAASTYKNNNPIRSYQQYTNDKTSASSDGDAQNNVNKVGASNSATTKSNPISSAKKNLTAKKASKPKKCSNKDTQGTSKSISETCPQE